MPRGIPNISRRASVPPRLQDEVSRVCTECLAEVGSRTARLHSMEHLFCVNGHRTRCWYVTAGPWVVGVADVAAGGHTFFGDRELNEAIRETDEQYNAVCASRAKAKSQREIYRHTNDLKGLLVLRRLMRQVRMGGRRLAA